MVSRLKRPMRFSLSDRSVDFERFEVNVTELEMRPSEGQLYIYWNPPVCDTCLGLSDEMCNWEHERMGLLWTCPEHVPEFAENVEVYGVRTMEDDE